MNRMLGALLALVLLLSGCASSDPLGTKSRPTGWATSTRELTIGSQQYYSNEIIAELFAQSLESRGWTIHRSYQIGQREVYLPELEAGRIDLVPEYAGNLLQYYDKDSKARTTAEVVASLRTALPHGLQVLEPAPASDQDSYVVTREMADRHGLRTIDDLSRLGQVTIAANAELARRSYGPSGLKQVYGVEATVLPVEDSGGPLTVKALVDGKVQVADVYSADPSIAKNSLVALGDPKSLVLPQNVAAVVSSRVGADAASIITLVSSRLTTDELRRLNARSIEQQVSSAVIAKTWLTEKGLVS